MLCPQHLLVQLFILINLKFSILQFTCICTLILSKMLAAYLTKPLLIIIMALYYFNTCTVI